MNEDNCFGISDLDVITLSVVAKLTAELCGHISKTAGMIPAPLRKINNELIVSEMINRVANCIVSNFGNEGDIVNILTRKETKMSKAKAPVKAPVKATKAKTAVKKVVSKKK